MVRTVKPLWLAYPSRFAGSSRRQAGWILGVLVLLLLATLTAITTPGPPPVSRDATQRAEDQADVVLYESIVDGVRHGGNYYAVTANALRAGNYPLRPFVTFRLPTLAMVQAVLPPWLTIALLYALAGAVMAAWFVRLSPALARPPPRIIALVLLAGGMVAFVQADLAAFHEVWAGLLIALSIAVRRRGHFIEAISIALIAMLIRETAALYVGVMAVLALIERDRRETIGWLAATAIFALAVAAHAHAVAHVVRPLDPASPGWSGLLGFGFFVKTMTLSTALSLAPQWIAAPIVGLALFGWAAWRDAMGLRMLAIFAAYALLLALFGRPDTFYWGLLVAPSLLVGLVFVPDGLRDLVRAALDKRRITVTRTAR